MGARNGDLCVVFLPVFVVPDCGVHLRFNLSHSVVVIGTDTRKPAQWRAICCCLDSSCKRYRRILDGTNATTE
mgnify:FL=1